MFLIFYSTSGVETNVIIVLVFVGKLSLNFEISLLHIHVLLVVLAKEDKFVPVSFGHFKKLN